MARGKGRSTDYVLHVFGDDLLIPDAVLHGAHRAGFIEGTGSLRDRSPGMNRLGGDDAIVAARKFPGIAGRVELRGEVGSARETETVLIDSLNVLCPDVIGPDFRLALLGKMRGKQAAYRATTNDTDF